MTSRRRELAPVAVAALAATAPFAVATLRAIRRGWYPIGDNAFFALRARDVLTEHHPLLGTWTSASLSVGTDLNNPGPLLFDLLAMPAKIDPAAGVAVGVGALNVAAIAVIAFLAWRRAGALGAAWSMASAAALAWTLGSELLFDPWQPHALLFPFLAFVFAVWSMVDGDSWALPIAVGLASLVVQSHLSYAVLVPLLSLVGVVGLAAAARRRRPRGSRTLVGPILVAFGVGAACWLQPLVDQVRGEGNLVTLATHASSGATKIGPGLATRLAAWVLSLPPFWGRPSMARALYVPGPEPLPGRAVAAASLVLVVVALVAAIVWRRALKDRAAVSALTVAVAGVVGSWVTTAMLPVGILGIVPHQFKWLWPVGIFATFALAVAVLPRVPMAAWAGTLVAVVLGVLAMPTWNAHSGPSADAASIPTARALVDGMRLDSVHEVLFDPRGLRFAEPYSTVVLLELQRRGIEFRVNDEVLARQVGTSRLVDDASPLPRLVEREGDAAFAPPAGATVVSRVRALSTAEKAELDSLEDEVAGYIAEHGLPLNERGRRVQRDNGLPALRSAGPVLRDPGALLGTAELIRIVRSDLAPIDPSWRERFARYAELREGWNVRTVALFLVPPA
ncbi:MAG TPA: hypothetical protein VM143_00825 [Acidimicrobiales bacterium]|nr:hypothetical protein [Acidimicrobiales bacterium]